jgi:hypothetical protein
VSYRTLNLQILESQNAPAIVGARVKVHLDPTARVPSSKGQNAIGRCGEK